MDTLKAKKYLVKNIHEAMLLIKKDFGDDAILLNKRKIISSNNEVLWEIVGTSSSYTYNITTNHKNLNYQNKIKKLEKSIIDIKNMLEQMINLYLNNSENYSNFSFKRMLELGIEEDIAKEINKILDKNISNDEELSKALKKIINFEYKKITKKNIAFIGPTGVGKTTTMSKITTYLALNKKNVCTITLDFFRIGAKEQLKNYNDLIEIETKFVHTQKEFKRILNENKNHLLYIDTTGSSQYDEENINKTFTILGDYKQKVHKFLVMNASVKYEELERIKNQFSKFGFDEIIFTKLDETVNIGNLFSFMYKNKIPVRYITNGQMIHNNFKELKNASDIVNFMFK